jgi:hypothetical protein
MRVAACAAAGLSLLALCAFAPDHDPPSLSQEVIPKSWIPEWKKKEKEDQPSLAFRSTPQVESAIAGDTVLGPDCPVPLGERGSELEATMEPVRVLIKAKNYAQALRLADEAQHKAVTGADRYLVLAMFAAIFEAMGEKENLASALSLMVEGQCFLVPGEKDHLQRKLDALGLPKN